MINVHTLAIILLWIAGLIFLIGISIIVFNFGRRSMKNNPDKGLILMLNGDQLDPIKAKRNKIAEKSIEYIYHKTKRVLVPKKFRTIYVKARRAIFIDHIGQIISSPFESAGDKPLNGIITTTDEQGNKITESEKTDLIYDFLESNVGDGAISAIKGKVGTGSVVVIAIVAFIIGIGSMFAFQQFQNTMKQQAAVRAQQQQQQEQPPENIQQY